MTAATDEVLIRIEGEVGRITLSRPKALHALTTAMCKAMTEALLAWRDDPAVKLVSGPITSDRILAELDDDLDYAYHLACFHGNQSSIHDPLMDHENNTLTTLKLFERLKDIKTLKKVVYSAAGCAVAAKTFDGATATTEDAPVSLFHDSPYSISKLIGEMYGNYYLTRHGLPFVKARFQNVYGPGEIAQAHLDPGVVQRAVVGGEDAQAAIAWGQEQMQNAVQ